MTVVTENLNLPDYSTRKKILEYINGRKQNSSIQDNYVTNKNYNYADYNTVKIYDSNKQIIGETIEPHISDFIKTVARKFDKNIKTDYYIGEIHNQIYLALRWGLYKDCIKLYSLGNELGIFSGYINNPEPLIYTVENRIDSLYAIDNQDLRNKLNNAINMLTNKDKHIDYLNHRIGTRDDDLNWFKEEKRKEIYNNWHNGIYISNVRIYEGE